MKAEKMSTELLKHQISKSKSFVADLKKTLDYIPETSILGRLSVTLSLVREENKLKTLELEFKKRTRYEEE